MSAFNAFTAMIYRQLKRWWNARSRVTMTILNPLIWMVFLGLGWGSIFNPQNIPSIPGIPDIPNVVEILRSAIDNYFKQLFGGVNYVTFMLTGVIVMTAFMGSFISGISVIWDKQFGFLKETLVAPAPRSIVILGRIVGDSIVTTIQSLVIVLLSIVLTNEINLINTPLVMCYIFIMSLGFASLGTAISLKFRSMEGFQMVVNLITMPLVFVSGVFYPVTTMPEWMKLIAESNPLTYSVHAVRYWLASADVGFEYMNPITDLAILTLFAIAMITIAAKTFEKTTLED
ncbi:MAG: ABC transporter [Thermoprotei archaeon]|nr:MAG: ABC transporter [Thermoprotei archaeon]